MHGSTRDKTAASARVARLVDLYAPGVWDWDIASNTFTVTNGFRQIFGVPPSAPVSLDDIVTLTHPDDRIWASPLQNPSFGVKTYPLVARYRIHRPNGEMRWISSRIWAHDHAPDGPISGYTGTVMDITDEVVTADALAQSEQRLRYAIEAGKMAVWEVDLETGGVTQSAELNHLFGYPADTFITLEKARACYNAGELERLAAERNTAEAVQARAAAGDFALRLSRASVSVDDRTHLQAELAITTKAGKPKRLMLRAQYVMSPEGKPRLTGLLFDITETKMAEERSILVARELQHRVKNSLAVIGTLAVQSFRGKADADAGLKDFQGRLMSLSAANDLILSGNSETAHLHELIAKIIRPYHTGTAAPFEVNGPSTVLQAQAATSIGMVLHELCTNAVKYGALTAPQGSVSIAWTVEDSILALTWQEHNGPPPAAPKRKGFGFRLLENVIKGTLAGTLAVDFEPSGLVCRFKVSIDR